MVQATSDEAEDLVALALRSNSVAVENIYRIILEELSTCI